MQDGVQALYDQLWLQETFLRLQESDNTLFSNVAWKRFRSTPLAEGVVELAKSGRVQPVHILIDRHYNELSKTWGTTSFVESVLNHFPTLSLSEEQSLVRLVRECICPRITETMDLVDFCMFRARNIADKSPQTAHDWLSTLRVSCCEELSNHASPLQQIRYLVHSSEKTDLDSKVSPLYDAIETLIVLQSNFGIEFPTVSLASIESNKECVLVDIASKMLADGATNNLFEELVSNFPIDRETVILDQIKILKNCFKESFDETNDYGEEEEDKSKRIRTNQESVDSSQQPSSPIDYLFDRIYSLISLLVNSERISEAIYETMISVNGNRHLSREKNEEFFTALATLFNEKVVEVGGYFGQLVVSYIAVKSVTQSLVEYPEFESIRDRPDFLMSKSNVTFIVNKLCCELGAIETAIQLGTVFPYIRPEDCWLLRLTTLYFENSLLEIQQIFLGENNLFSSENERSIVARDFACIVLNDNRMTRDWNESLQLLQFVVLPLVAADEHLVDKFEKINLLYIDFGQKVLMDELDNNDAQTKLFSSISDFENILTETDSVVSRSKLERAKILFKLGGESVTSYFDYGKICDDKTFRSVAELSDFLSNDIGAMVLQRPFSNQDEMKKLFESVIVPCVKSYAILNRADDVMCAFGWSPNYVSGDISRILSELRSVEQNHFEFEPEFLSDAIVRLVDKTDNVLQNLKIDYLLKDLESIKLGTEILPDKGDNKNSVVVVVATEKGENRKYAEMCDWIDSVFIGKLNMGSLDREEFLKASEGDKVAIKNILKCFLPQLIVASGFDLELCREFLEILGKADNKSVGDLIASYMICLLGNRRNGLDEGKFLKKLKNSVREFRTTCDDFVNRIMTFVVPTIGSDDQLLKVLLDMILVECGDDKEPLNEIRNMGHILDKICILNKLSNSDSVLLKLEQIVRDGERVLLDYMTTYAGRCEIVEESVELAKILKIEKKLILKLFEKIINFTELTLMNDSVPIKTVVVLLQNLPEQEREIVGKQLIMKLPLSDQQLRLVEFFSNSSWLVDGEVLLVRNRLILRDHGLSSLEQVLIQRGIKDVIEEIFFAKKMNLEKCVMSLVKENKINWNKFRLEACKRMIRRGADEESVIQLVRCGDTGGDEETFVNMMMRMFFAQDEGVAVKVSCFSIMMKLFKLSTIKRVYGKKLEDLLDIQKNLLYIKLLGDKNIVKTHEMAYREFHDMNKRTIVKALVKNAHKLDTLQIAAWMVCDYRIFDFDILGNLKSRLVSQGIDGMEIMRSIGLEVVDFHDGELSESSINKHTVPIALNESCENVVPN